MGRAMAPGSASAPALVTAGWEQAPAWGQAMGWAMAPGSASEQGLVRVPARARTPAAGAAACSRWSARCPQKESSAAQARARAPAKVQAPAPGWALAWARGWALAPAREPVQGPGRGRAAAWAAARVPSSRRCPAREQIRPAPTRHCRPCTAAPQWLRLSSSSCPPVIFPPKSRHAAQHGRDSPPCRTAPLACAAWAAAIRRISPGGAGLIVALFTAVCADDPSCHQCTAPGNAAAPGEVELEPARDHESMSFPARQRHPGVARASRLRCDAHRSPMPTARWTSRAV